MAIIIPAILPTSRKDLEDKLALLKGIVNEVQVDIVDGVFAGPASWPYTDANAFASSAVLPQVDTMRTEVDLMVRDPEQVTGTWIQAGATRILVHLESTTYLPEIITDLRDKYGHEKGFALGFLSFGIAIDIATDLSRLDPYLNDADYVQFMGIDHDGKQGEPFDPVVIAKIKAFRSKHPDMLVQVDGGVNFESIPHLLTAGASRLIVGSALWRAPDLKTAYERLVHLTEEHGIYE